MIGARLTTMEICTLCVVLFEIGKAVSDMARCDDCLANKVCDHNRFGFENCGNFIPADVAPKSEVERPMFENTKQILHHLKRQIHEKAVRPHNAGIDAYISLKVFDAILQTYLNHLE